MSFRRKLRHFQQFLLRWWGWDIDLPPVSWKDEPLVELDDELQIRVRDLAKSQKRSEEEMVADLISSALTQRTAEYQANREIQDRWAKLTMREQQVATLVCQGFTNREIGARLYIAPGTVKVYVRHGLDKLGFRTRAEMRTALASWDFGPWEDWASH